MFIPEPHGQLRSMVLTGTTAVPVLPQEQSPKNNHPGMHTFSTPSANSTLRIIYISCQHVQRSMQAPSNPPEKRILIKRHSTHTSEHRRTPCALHPSAEDQATQTETPAAGHICSLNHESRHRVAPCLYLDGLGGRGRGERTTCARTTSSLKLRRANARRPLTQNMISE